MERQMVVFYVLSYEGGEQLSKVVLSVCDWRWAEGLGHFLLGLFGSRLAAGGGMGEWGNSTRHSCTYPKMKSQLST